MDCTTSHRDFTVTAGHTKPKVAFLSRITRARVAPLCRIRAAEFAATSTLTRCNGALHSFEVQKEAAPSEGSSKGSM
jgi:hypothetical protein